MKTFGLKRLLNNKLFMTPKFSPILFCLLMSTAHAGFEVQDYEQQLDYGNAQNETFRRAVEYEESLDANDRAFLASVNQEAINNRWYWKLLVARPKAKIQEVRNETHGVAGVPAVVNEEDKILHFDLGWGYKWNRWAAELELIIGEGLDYQSNPILTGQPIQLKSTVKHFVFFINAEYEIPTYFDFISSKLHPYINMGPGIAVKTTDSQTLSLGGQGRTQESKRSTDFAWHFTLGAKYQVTGSILIDVAYRWMQLGKVKFGPIEGFTLTAKELNTRGFYLGITYQL